MNRRKISAMLAVALITSQIQNITFAETITNNKDVEKVNEVVLENVDDNNSDSILNEIVDIEDGETTDSGETANEEIVEDQTYYGQAEDQIQDETQYEVQDEVGTEIIQDEVETETQDKVEDEKTESNQDSTKESENYNVTGKLELDINFSTPIKLTESKNTGIEVVLKDSLGDDVAKINLGKEITSGEINDIKYSLEALGSKRDTLDDSATELSFYHLTFEKLPVGTYSIVVSGSGYINAEVSKIEIINTSKRVLLGTSDNIIEIDEKETEKYLGAFLVGDTDGDKDIDIDDYNQLKQAIKENSKEGKYDLNRDGKVDITDLAYVHQNMNKSQGVAIIEDTDIIINPENVKIEINDTISVTNGEIKDILKDTDSAVKLEAQNEISEENPIEIPMDLTGILRSTNAIESINIKAPSANSPSSGEIIIPGAGEGGEDLRIKFDDSNIARTVARTSDGKELDNIKIDLGKQVAVSKITIKITGSRTNKNLAEIAKVEFLNNVYKEMPKPKMNIPVINSFKSTTQVGQESMTIGWDHETNVTGYEIEVTNLSNNQKLTYKTSKNSLRIEKVQPYATYRIRIQSVSGDWKSGYKDEYYDEKQGKWLSQDGYDENATGTTNLTNNSNDKDGVADNVDKDFNPKSWDWNNGVLTDGSDSLVDVEVNGETKQVANFGRDSIIEVQVIPETAPEGPEGITIKGGYRQLEVSWKSHAKAKDYELYYRKVGTKEWFKANDNGTKYVDSDVTNDIPDGAANLAPGEADSQDFIRGTSYTIKDLEDTSTYEIMMTATNHHGTGGLSQVYMGSTTKLIPPVTTNYKLINNPNGVTELTNHIEKVEYKVGEESSINAIVDNDYSTHWTWNDWDTSIYGKTGPIITFDKEYELDTIRVIRRLDFDTSVYSGNIGVRNEETGEWEYISAKVANSDSNRVVTLKLDKPIKAKEIQVNLSVYNKKKVSISEIKFYEYDSLQSEVDNLFADDLHLSIKDTVSQELIDSLTKRAKTIDPVNLEYHPNQAQILEELKRAQDLLNELNLSDNIITLDSTIHNIGIQNKIGQINNYQSLGVAVRPGDKVTIYVASPNRTDTKFDLVLTQFNAESGTAYKVIETLSIGKNEITIPETGFDMNYEKGGNLYIGLKDKFAESNTFKVRVSGGMEIPHLNVNNIIDNEAKADEVKEKIRTYIKELREYVEYLPKKYPSTATPEQNSENIYTYDPKTSILNATDIEGERIMLSLAADQVLAGIESGLKGNEEAQVDRLYNTLLAWEQLMKISYSQQGLLEAPIDLNNNGTIEADETKYYEANRAPKNRMNIKYQRMFTGAFMYASGHHVGIGYGSIAGTMTGVPFEFDESGNLLNSDKGQLFGWGISHEIGHVHDISGLTYAETTNNILALITQTFNDINESRLESFGAYEKMYDKVTSNSVGLASDILTRLGMFWQLHLAYDNDYTYNMLDLNSDSNLENDTFFAKLYRATRVNGTAKAEAGYDATAQTFIRRASDAVQKDLSEFFEKWGLVSSPQTKEYLASKGYEKEERAIYYLNDQARRLRLEAGANTEILNMEEGTEVIGDFGTDSLGNKIKDRSYLNQKEVPLTFSVSKDSEKILGYEIIRKETTSEGTKELVVGFVERDENGQNGLTSYIDEIDAVNNKTFEYKVRAYDYNLNKTEETVIGTIKVNHDGSIAKSNWVFDTNTRSTEDVADENSGHGQVQDGSIKKINDNDTSTIYTASKTTDNNGNIIAGNPYVTIDLGDSKSVVGLKYNPGQAQSKKFTLKSIFSRSTEETYSPITKYEVHVSKDGKTWQKAHSGEFEKNKENVIYFNEKGNSENSTLWAYEAQYVKLVAVGATTISIAELDVLGPVGDNIEIGTDSGNKVYENGIGVLKESYTYADGKEIPKGSIIVTGEYKGDPAFNAPLVLNENEEHLSLEANVLLFAEIPEGSELGEVAKGTWLYYITPEEQQRGEVSGKKIKAELYRYNKLDGDTPIGQRLVSDTFLYDIDLENLPEIQLSSSKARALSSEADVIIEINKDVMKNIFNNRN